MLADLIYSRERIVRGTLALRTVRLSFANDLIELRWSDRDPPLSKQPDGLCQFLLEQRVNVFVRRFRWVL